jgi:hypothetical protein
MKGLPDSALERIVPDGAADRGDDVYVAFHLHDVGHDGVVLVHADE